MTISNCFYHQCSKFFNRVLKDIWQWLSYALLLLASVLSAASYAGDATKPEGPKPWELSMDEFRSQALALSAGRSFVPARWPGNARVGILISFDVDNEALAIVEGADPLVSSIFQFGTQKGLKRVLKVLDRHEVPATFFIPAATLKLTPEIATSIKRSGRHEFAAHGWIHEKASDMTPSEQKQYLRKSVDEIARLTGQKPVGYRAPYGVVTEHTIPNLQEMGFLYHSGFTADDVPYELMRNGQSTGLVELPPSINLEDSILDPMNTFAAGIQSPGDTLQSYRDAFDVAYEEGGMILIVMHPHVSGKLSRIKVLEGLIEYAKSHEKVWFGTHRDAAEHFRKQLNSK